MDKIVLTTFPSNRTDALTMLCLQNQDLTGKTPEDLVSLFQDTHKIISDSFTSHKTKNISNP